MLRGFDLPKSRMTEMTEANAPMRYSIPETPERITSR